MKELKILRMSSVFFSIALLGMLSYSYAQEGQAHQMLSKQDRYYFIENKGQWHSDVLYLARMGGLDAWITRYGVNYTFFKLEEVASANKHEKDWNLYSKYEHKEYNVLGHRVLMQLENHNPNPPHEGLHQQSGYYNYFIGNDATKHATNVGLYKEAVVKDVYPGIDMRYYFDKGALRYDYVVHAGSDPSQISFTLAGANKTYMNDKGQLVFETRFGEVAITDLEVYQGGDKKRVQASFVCRDGERWGFSLENYDKTQDLVIDPLIYSTYLGGSDWEEGWSITVDSSANAFITGRTFSSNYDITTGVFQSTFGGWEDAFITKLNSTGTAIIYSTFIGGDELDNGESIFVDNAGNTYLTGATQSTNFPTTSGSFQTTFDGTQDAYVLKLNTSGTTLHYSTYLGGNDWEYGLGIQVDDSGNAYVSGQTLSDDFDVTAGAFQTTYGQNKDVFITKLNAAGSGLLYSTFLGGSNDDYSYGFVMDSIGNTYLLGYTRSSDFDVTAGVYQSTLGGDFDVFVSKLNASGSSLIFSTYLGGSGEDKGTGIFVDKNGFVYCIYQVMRVPLILI